MKGPAGHDGDRAATLVDGPPSPATHLPVVEAGRYEVVGEIGRGGIGRVLRVRDNRLFRTVALKELLEHEAGAEARFLREAAVTARLQHPGIVPIHEVDRWPSGEPFYVMKLVSGRSLATAAIGSLDKRALLVPHVLAVAEAVAYAHSRGVIHRDLKPHNVLIGAFGETVVIDWGLAKVLGAPDDDADAARRTDAAEDLTGVGAVLGTPAYMPPEQARGEPVDARADVYAVGAILYHVLAGQPPYRGTTAAQVIAAVAERAPPPLASLVPGLPADLVAIAERAMARDPAARYRTAQELALDLRRFTAGQLVGSHRYSPGELLRRWLRRHRAPLAVATVAVVVLGALGVAGIARVIAERDRADAQHALVEQRRGEVEDLMGFLLFDMRGSLRRIGRLDIMSSVAHKAAAYYRDRAAEENDTARHQRSAALLILGDVLRSQGDVTGASTSYLASLATAEEVARRDPSRVEPQIDLVEAHESIGQNLMMQGDTSGALDEFAAEVEIAGRLAAAAPGDADGIVRLADAHLNVGNAFAARDNAPAALAEYRQATMIGARAAALSPTQAGPAHVLALARQSTGNSLLRHGDVAGAVDEYRRALLESQEKRARNPEPDVERDVYLEYMRLGAALAVQGVSAGALSEYAAARGAIDRLMAADPGSTDLPRDLARIHTEVGGLLIDAGDGAGAEPELLAAIAIFDGLAARDPTNSEWQYDLYEAHDQLGRLFESRSDWARAIDEFHATAELASRQVGLDPAHSEWQTNLALAHQRAGQALCERGDLRAGLAEYRAAVDIDERRLATDPGNIDVAHGLLASLISLGDTLTVHGQPAAAIDAYRRALEIVADLHAANSAGGDVEMISSDLHAGMADAMVAQRRWADALAHARASQAGLERLVQLDPSNARVQWNLVAAHEQVGDILLRTGDRTGARHEWRAALDLAHAAIGRDPANRKGVETQSELEKKVRAD